MISKIAHPSFLVLALFIFFSCKKSDSGPGAPPAPPVPPAPVTIASISPTSGLSSTLDTIVGSNFSAKDSVYINGKNASIVSASTTQLVVKVPPQAGTGKVTIRDSAGSATTGPVFTFMGNTYLVSTFAGSGTPGSADGAGTAASFFDPVSLAIDSDDNLFVADHDNNMIRKITPAGVVTTFAGSNTQGAIDGTGTAASFNAPFGVAVDGNGNVYVADNGNNKIRKITFAGAVSTFAGSGSAGSIDATGTAASFDLPVTVAVDGNGNVFVSDYGNEKIRKITPARVVTSLAGNGSVGSSDGNGTAASFIDVQGISCDVAGNLYLADAGNHNIRKITPDGTVTSIAGNSGQYGYADGTGLLALFHSPNALAIDGNGFIYVADETNSVIRQINPEGVVTLLAGIVGSFGADNGPALKAKFAYPAGIVIDSHGNIFVADSDNNTIRKLTPQ